jgi:hypothetical protein
MKKNVLVLLLITGLVGFNSGCTSKESQSDEQAIENADVEKIETIDSVDAPPPTTADATATSPDNPALSDASLDAALNEGAPAAPPENLADAAITESPVADASASSAPTVDTPATEAPAVTETQLSPETNAITEVPGSSSEITETPIVDASPIESVVAATPVTKPSSSGPTLKKVNSLTPYQAKAGGWVNTVYIARPKEKLADISQKIYSSDKTSELKAIADNSYLKSRAPKAGDKIYYVSPNRPDDSTKMLLYYEDMGLVPQTYVAKPGENLRKVSKSLLGYDNAWKEVWSSNSIESKTSLKDGEILRYWTSDSNEVMASSPPAPPPQGAATVADSSQAPQATAQMAPPTAATDASASLPPPPADANANLPPPPTDAMAAGSTEAPPPPLQEAPPPPPPPPASEDVVAAPEGEKQKANLDEAAAEEEEGGLSSDTMMSMGALGVLVALLAFVIIRKRKQKAQMNNLEMNA